LTDKCSFDDALTYSLCLNVNPKGTKLYASPFSYHSEAANFLIAVKYKEETSVKNSDLIKS
jgi:hypothetical protein